MDNISEVLAGELIIKLLQNKINLQYIYEYIYIYIYIYVCVCVCIYTFSSYITETTMCLL
jgi:hypothetical protein